MIPGLTTAGPPSLIIERAIPGRNSTAIRDYEMARSRSRPGSGSSSSSMLPTALTCLILLALAAPAPGEEAGPGDTAALGNGFWGPLDPEVLQQVESVRLRCEPADLRRCGSLSLFYSRTSAQLEEEPSRQRSLYRLACGDGFAAACLQLAELALEEGSPARDPAIAARLLERSCTGGESRGCLGLAEMLESGRGVGPDPQRAAEIYERECRASRPVGCWRLALLLLERDRAGRIGVDSAVFDYLRRACTAGIGDACYKLAELLSDEGRDSELTTCYFGQACDRHHGDGCLRFADRIAVGEGVAPDPQFADSIYHDLCDQGRSEACLRTASSAP